MKKISAILVLCMSLLSCSDNDNSEEPIVGPKPESLQNIFAETNANQTQNFQMNAEDDVVTFTTLQGTEMNVNRSCLKLNGQPVTGLVDFELIELFDKGSLLASNKPTVGNNNGIQTLMQTGGVFYINAKQNGQQLTLDCPIALNFPTELSGEPLTSPQLFSGTPDDYGLISWNVINGAPITIGTLNSNSTVSAYNTSIETFGWFNCAEFSNSSNPTTSITTQIPQGYENGNYTLFLIPKETSNTVGTLDLNYPIGMKYHLVFISTSQDKYLYSIKQDSITDVNPTVIFRANEFQNGTASQLSALLNELP